MTRWNIVIAGLHVMLSTNLDWILLEPDEILYYRLKYDSGPEMARHPHVHPGHCQNGHPYTVIIENQQMSEKHASVTTYTCGYKHALPLEGYP
ncbi:hypothetical protein J1614_001150 [Plenodomus biglobosus]|nr:hypothetical protein J1614_001150 [Plenodomus biglobosus]